MGRLDFDAMAAIVNRQEAGDYALSPASVVCCLTALQDLQCRFRWRDGDEKIGNDDWDTAENWVDSAIKELLVPIEGNGVGTELASAKMWHEEAKGTHAGTALANTWAARELNEIDDPDSIIADLTDNEFKPVAGTYELYAVSPFAGNQNIQLRLYNVTADEALDVSTVGGYTGVATLLVPRFTANGTDYYTVDMFTKSYYYNFGLGKAKNYGSEVEVYTVVVIKELFIE